jgi:hypothetical protein
VEVDGGVWPNHKHAWICFTVNSNVASVHVLLRRQGQGWQDLREADPEGEAVLTSMAHASAPAGLGVHGRAVNKQSHDANDRLPFGLVDRISFWVSPPSVASAWPIMPQPRLPLYSLIRASA